MFVRSGRCRLLSPSDDALRELRDKPRPAMNLLQVATPPPPVHLKEFIPQGVHLKDFQYTLRYFKPLKMKGLDHPAESELWDLLRDKLRPAMNLLQVATLLPPVHLKYFIWQGVHLKDFRYSLRYFKPLQSETA